MSNRVKELREDRNWTQGDLADRIGVTWQTISRIENAHTRIMPKHEKTLAKAFGIDPSSLYDLPEPRRVSLDEEWHEHEASFQEQHRAYSRENYRPTIPGAIPEINVELGAGEGRVGEVISFPIGSETYSAHQVVEEWFLPESYLDRVIESRSGDTVIMPVVGDSMSPTYSPGDRVIVDMTQDRLVMDTVYAISDGQSPPQIKRLQRVMFAEPPEVLIISDNQSHESQRVPLDRLRILGRIVGVVAKR